jgi:hypothetical protein
MQLAKSFLADLDEVVRLYFTPVTAIIREFKKAVAPQGVTRNKRLAR